MTTIDDAFMPVHRLIEHLLSFGGDLTAEEEGVHSYIYECEIESPLELDVKHNEGGGISLGSTPPLYYANTSFRPSFHRLRFTAERCEASDGG
jgi:hypothetical protein